MNKPIHPDHLAFAARTTARRAAAAIVTGIAETDVNFATAAKRLGKDEEVLRRWLYDLIDGKADCTIDRLADLAFAHGFVLQPSIRRVELPELSENTP